MHEFPIYLVVALFVIAIVGLNIYLEAKRRRELEEEAAKLGFRFLPVESTQVVLALPHKLFNRGHGRALKNVLEGSVNGLPVRLFDYQYVTGSGKNRTTYIQTVAAYRLTQSRLPAFEMLPERFYHMIAEAVGYADIDFDGYPEFSGAYRLLSADEPGVRRLFSPHALGELGSKPGWNVEGADQTLLVYRAKIRVSPREIADFLAQSRQVARALGLR